MKDYENNCLKCGRELGDFDAIELFDYELVLTFTCKHCQTIQDKVYTTYFSYGKIEGDTTIFN